MAKLIILDGDASNVTYITGDVVETNKEKIFERISQLESALAKYGDHPDFKTTRSQIEERYAEAVNQVDGEFENKKKQIRDAYDAAVARAKSELYEAYDNLLAEKESCLYELTETYHAELDPAVLSEEEYLKTKQELEYLNLLKNQFAEVEKQEKAKQEAEKILQEAGVQSTITPKINNKGRRLGF